MNYKLENWCWLSMSLCALTCAISRGFFGLIAGAALGLLIGALTFALKVYLAFGLRLVIWAALIGLSAALLAK